MEILWGYTDTEFAKMAYILQIALDKKKYQEGGFLEVHNFFHCKTIEWPLHEFICLLKLLCLKPVAEIKNQQKSLFDAVKHCSLGIISLFMRVKKARFNSLLFLYNLHYNYSKTLTPSTNSPRKECSQDEPNVY